MASELDNFAYGVGLSLPPSVALVFVGWLIGRRSSGPLFTLIVGRMTREKAPK